MTKYVFISYAAAVVYIYLGIYVYRLAPESRLNRLFLVICSLWAWWSLTYAMVFPAANTDDVWFWYRLSALGWCNFPGVTSHFALLMAGKSRRINRWLLYLLLYLPGLFFTGVVFSPWPMVVADFVQIDNLWFEMSAPGMLSRIFPLYYASHALFAAVTALLWGRSSDVEREERAAKIFAYGIFITLVPAALINNVLPLLGIRLLPAIGYTFGILWLIGITYSIFKYKMMNLTAAIAAEAIMARIRDIVILTDPSGAILRINEETLGLLDRSEGELSGRTLFSLAKERSLLKEQFHAMRECEVPGGSCETEFLTREGESIPVHLSGACIQDEAGGILGVVVHGIDLRPKRELEQLNQELVRSNRELEEAQRIAAREMELAVNVQYDLFPREAPVTEEWETAFLFKPARGVSGDMYDFYQQGDRLTGLSLFDVSGHGISSGLITIPAKSIISRSFYRSEHQKMGMLMETINRNLIKDIGQVDHYLTGILLRFRGDIVEYANAAHADLLYRSAGSGNVRIVEDRERDNKSFFLGVREMSRPFNCLRFKVFPGDVLLLFSDGLYDAVNGNNLRFSLDLVRENLQRVEGNNAEEMLHNFMRSFYDFIGDAPLTDDLTVVLLKRK